jgi:molybdate transport system substrate-binding protein
MVNSTVRLSMKRTFRRAGPTVLLIALFVCWHALAVRAEGALVAVAANFTEAARELVAEFEKQTGHKLSISTGATGQLYAQIINGAPFDIFLAADEERPLRLEQQGMIVEGSRFAYAVGQLVYWRPRPAEGAAGDIESERDIGSIAIASPKLAPYGRAAQQVLKNKKNWKEIEPKLVFGQNIAQTYAMIATGNADAGYVARSQMKGDLSEAKGFAVLVDPKEHDPIRQDAVLLVRAKDNPAARAFMNFLKSENARKIIARFGYLEGGD